MRQQNSTPYRASHGKWPLTLMTLAVMAGIGTASAAVTFVTHSGIVNVPIPADFSGVYVDLDSGVPTDGPDPSGEAPDGIASYTLSHSDVAGWDVNFFFGGIGIAFSPTFQPFREDPSVAQSFIHEMTFGDTVDSVTAAANALGVGADYGGSGTTLGGPAAENHFGDGTNLFENNVEGYIAFVLNPETTPQYGWMRVTLRDDGSDGVIHEWAYAEDSILVGEIPEPGSMVLLALGSLALLRRRR